MMAENFPKLIKDMNPQTQEVQDLNVNEKGGTSLLRTMAVKGKSWMEICYYRKCPSKICEMNVFIQFFIQFSHKKPVCGGG